MTQPQIIGGYRIVAPLGYGGMGSVHRAIEEKSGQVVALKVLPPLSVADRPALERFSREVDVLSKLSHPNIVRCLGPIFDEPPYCCYPMEYVAGADVGRLLKRVTKFDPAFAGYVAASTLEALEDAHRADVVHRDIKPSNLLLDQHLVVKVTDFGLARAPGSATLTVTGQVLGTPTYMSPEQCRGEPTGRLSDLYSLGIVLYEMLSGHPPFRAESPYAILNMHQGKRPQPIADIDAALWDVLARALAKKPEDRFRDASEMRDALVAAVPAFDPESSEDLRQIVGREARRTPDRDLRGVPLTTETERVRRRVLLRTGASVLGVAVLAGLWVFRPWEGDENPSVSPPPADPEMGASGAVSILLRNGDTLSGVLERIDRHQVSVEMPDGQVLSIPRAEIFEIVHE